MFWILLETRCDIKKHITEFFMKQLIFWNLVFNNALNIASKIKNYPCRSGRWTNKLVLFKAILQDTKQNANYENLMSDTVEKRVAKNLLCDSCWSSSWAKKDLLLRLKTFLTQLDDQHESHNKLFATHFSTVSDTKFS